MLKLINKEYLISSLKDFNEKVLSKIYAKIPWNKSVLDKLSESDDGILTFNGNQIGLKGEQGDVGLTGKDGESAYEIAIRNGFLGDEATWLESLKGEPGETGSSGEKGDIGLSAGFGTPTATVDNNVGIPSVEVTATGPETAKVFNFAFKNLKGEKGEAINAEGNGQEYVCTIMYSTTLKTALNSDNTVLNVNLGSKRLPSGYELIPTTDNNPYYMSQITFMKDGAVGYFAIANVLAIINKNTGNIDMSANCVWIRGNVPSGVLIAGNFPILCKKTGE